MLFTSNDHGSGGNGRRRRDFHNSGHYPSKRRLLEIPAAAQDDGP
jgi:hypothetical protein